MSENHPAPRRRSRMGERNQQIYSEPPAPAQSVFSSDMQDEETVDYAAYYSREGAELSQDAQPTFAPPPKLGHYGYASQLEPMQEAAQETAYTPSNVYRPREATWADEDRSEVLAESGLGYQVREDEQAGGKRKKKKKKRHTLRNLLIAFAVLALLGGAGWVFREPLLSLLEQHSLLPQPTETPFVPVVTPEPIKAYDAAPAVEMAASARNAISRISGTVTMETYAVTETHIITRHLRPNGMYDFYLFSAPEGRLLCYFEGLGPLDMIPQEGGGFYVSQAPYLVAANGSALIRTQNIAPEARLHPLYNGWAVVENEKDGSANYVNLDGQLISTLWFSRTFPFTGEHTLAYVDTGSTADADQRYLLYVLGTDGSMNRWLSTGHMEDVTACADGMAYMDDGALYRLPDTSAPMLHSPAIDLYLDCGAMVVQDAQSGKYGLFVNGEQHYEFAYDAIRPVESELNWDRRTFSGQGGSFVVHALAGEPYPQPLSYSFMLEKDGQREYVALSSQSSYPIRLQGEF